MKWTTGLSRESNTDQAVEEALEALNAEAISKADVILAFFSAHHSAQAEALALKIAERLPDVICIGCGTGGVVAEGAEVEDEPALSLVVGELPGVELAPLRLESDTHDTADFDWADDSLVSDFEAPHFLLISDLQTFDTDQLLANLDEAFPDSEKFGALIGGAGTDQVMLLEGQVLSDGAVGLAFGGDLEVETSVAQACRPIGEPLIVTSRTRNVIHRFDRGNPMEVFRETVRQLDPEDQKLAKHSMLVGLGLNHKYGEYNQGDFLMRNILGFNPKSGDLAVAAAIDDLDVIQFHLMDAETSSQQFERVLEDYERENGGTDSTRGALLFSCVDRGEQLYGHPNHESDLLQDHMGELPVGGCFCDGEIGRIGHRTFLHGYASTLTFFREPSQSE